MIADSCIVGPSAADILGVLPAAVSAGLECRELYTLSYHSLSAAERLAGGGGTAAFIGYASILAPRAARAPGAGRIVGFPAWRREAGLLRGAGVEAVPVELPWYYRAMSRALKRRIGRAARLLEAAGEKRSLLAEAAREILPAALEAAEAGPGEIDPESLGHLAARAIEERLPGRPEHLAALAEKALRPRHAWTGSLMGLRLYAAAPPSPRSLPLLLVVAHRLHEETRAPVLLAASGARHYYLAGVTPSPWTLHEAAMAYRLVEDTASLVITPTTIEGAAPPGPRLRDAVPHRRPRRGRRGRGP